MGFSFKMYPASRHRTSQQISENWNNFLYSTLSQWTKVMNPTAPSAHGEIKPNRTDWGRRPKRNEGKKKILEPNDNKLNIPKSTESNDSSPGGLGEGSGSRERSQIDGLMTFLKPLEKENKPCPNSVDGQVSVRSRHKERNGNTKQREQRAMKAESVLWKDTQQSSAKLTKRKRRHKWIKLEMERQCQKIQKIFRSYLKNCSH